MPTIGCFNLCFFLIISQRVSTVGWVPRLSTGCWAISATSTSSDTTSSSSIRPTTSSATVYVKRQSKAICVYHVRSNICSSLINCSHLFLAEAKSRCRVSFCSVSSSSSRCRRRLVAAMREFSSSCKSEKTTSKYQMVSHNVLVGMQWNL